MTYRTACKWCKHRKRYRSVFVSFIADIIATVIDRPLCAFVCHASPAKKKFNPQSGRIEATEWHACADVNDGNCQSFKAKWWAFWAWRSRLVAREEGL
ncbi:MAG: hypothetical protein ACM3X6_02930 [Patescibacteria group bacterium]